MSLHLNLEKGRKHFFLIEHWIKPKVKLALEFGELWHPYFGLMQPFHSSLVIVWMCAVSGRSGSGCRLSALWRRRWRWTMKYRALHIASYRTCAAPSRTWWHTSTSLETRSELGQSQWDTACNFVCNHQILYGSILTDIMELEEKSSEYIQPSVRGRQKMLPMGDQPVLVRPLILHDFCKST